MSLSGGKSGPGKSILQGLKLQDASLWIGHESEEKDLRNPAEASRYAENRYKSEEGVLATRYCNLGKQLVRNGITALCQGGVIGRYGRKSVFNPSDPFSGDAR
jgi:hypothetical protein